MKRRASTAQRGGKRGAALGAAALCDAAVGAPVRAAFAALLVALLGAALPARAAAESAAAGAGDAAPASAAPSATRSTAKAGAAIAVLSGPSLEPLLAQIAPAFTAVTGIPVVAETWSSLAELRPVTRNGRPADVVLSTDPELLRSKLSRKQAPRYVVFAANAMVVAYRRDSAYAKAIAAGTTWFEALRAPGVRFGRLDPALDPLGARAIFVLQLAREYYGTADLDAQILRPEQIVPAAALLPRLASGELDAALTYRSQAVAAGLGLLDLPIEINLADPGRRGVYQRARVDAGGGVQRGGPIALGAAVLTAAPNPTAAQRFVAFLSSREARHILDEAGFVVLQGFPLERTWDAKP